MSTVKCLSSSCYAQRPLAFTWQGERLEVERILAEWQAPGQRSFRLQTADQRIFILTWDEARQDWHIQPF